MCVCVCVHEQDKDSLYIVAKSQLPSYPALRLSTDCAMATTNNVSFHLMQSPPVQNPLPPKPILRLTVHPYGNVTETFPPSVSPPVKFPKLLAWSDDSQEVRQKFQTQKILNENMP